MADVFLSYARKDQAAVRRVNDALTTRGRDVWVDWEGIPPSAEWLKEIFDAIDAAGTFAFALSPTSLASETCRLELEHAVGHGKRIVPLLLEDVDAGVTPADVARINWVLLRDSDDFDAGIRALDLALNTDLDWVKAHTRLLVRAREWDDHERDPSYLLAGSDLGQAQDWLGGNASLSPQVTPLMIAYVTASQQGMLDRQQRQLRGFYIASIVYALFQSAISYFVVFDEISEEGLMALSPVWLLGLVFGVSGLTIGRTSLKRALIATAVGAGALVLFFLTAWEML